MNNQILNKILMILWTKEMKQNFWFKNQMNKLN